MNTTLIRTARTAGALYFAYVVIQIVADVVGRSSIIVYGDAATTAAHIAASAGLFKVGSVIDLIAAVLFLLSAWALYRLLKPVNPEVALLFLLLNATGVAIQCVSDIFLVSSSWVLSGADFLKPYAVDQLQALAMAFLYLYKNGYQIAQLFYGPWVLPLGYLVYKSGFLPRALGIVLMVHSCTWTATALQAFLFPGFTAITYVSWPLGFVAEVGLSLSLLFMALRLPRRDGAPDPVSSSVAALPSRRGGRDAEAP